MLKNRDKHKRGALKDILGRIFMISFGVFLFILFFQPFPLQMLDYNNRLLFVAGYGVIIFIVSFFLFFVLPLFFPKWFMLSKWESSPPFVLNFLLLIFSSVAFVFYTVFVGKAEISFYIVFKIVLVCLLPLLILIILYKNKALELQINNLKEENKYYFLKISKYEKKAGEHTIDVFSAKKSEKLTFKNKDIIWIKSADNYIEIYFLKNNAVEKKLLRNTLKNIELQLSNQDTFVKCHRTSIVNSLHIRKIIKSYSGNSLVMSFIEDEIPVSRQYLIQLKEIVSSK